MSKTLIAIEFLSNSTSMDKKETNPLLFHYPLLLDFVIHG